MLATYRLSAVAESLLSFPAKCSFGEQESCIFFLSLPISSCAAVSIHWSLSCLMLLHCSASPHALSPLSLSPLNAVRLVFLAYQYAHSVTLSPSLLLSYSLTDAHIDTNTITCTFLSSLFHRYNLLACGETTHSQQNKTKKTSKCGIHILKDWWDVHRLVFKIKGI